MRYGHIIDPRTGQPGRLWRAVCILCPDSGVADALSTALYLLPVEEGQKLLDIDSAEAMWMGMDGENMYSPGFMGFVKGERTDDVTVFPFFHTMVYRAYHFQQYCTKE